MIGTDETPDSESPRSKYVRLLLQTYRDTPGVLGRVRHADRELAARLYKDAVPLHLIKTAFLIAVARRIRNNAFSTPLPQIRSLHYFLPILSEIRERPLGHRDITQLRHFLGAGDPPL